VTSGFGVVGVNLDHYLVFGGQKGQCTIGRYAVVVQEVGCYSVVKLDQ